MLVALGLIAAGLVVWAFMEQAKVFAQREKDLEKKKEKLEKEYER